eukprot:546059_1
MSLSQTEINEYTKSTKEFYDSYCAEYVDKTEIKSNQIWGKLQEFSELTVQHTANTKVTILDLGCSYGRDCKALKEINKDAHIVGIDFSKKFIDFAKKTIAAENVDFYVMDMRSIHNHFKSNTFHGIWSCATILHIPKQELNALFAALFNILKPNGIFYCSVKKGEGNIFEIDSRYSGFDKKQIKKYWSYFNENEIEHYLKKNGFKIIKLDSSQTKQTQYQTHSWINVFAQKPKIKNDTHQQMTFIICSKYVLITLCLSAFAYYCYKYTSLQ